MATAHEIYDANIRDLPATEKFRLASMILDELNQTAAPASDYSDAWTDEDLRDLTLFAQEYASKHFPE